ncbi:MAG: restriction endonuclease subunit S [Deltaproteobacteria bacterium]|nr:restriction endonuclease subunit S [Deltaproteobacteria bacterium]
MTIPLPRLPDGWAWSTVEAVGAIDDQAVLTGPFGTSIGPDDFIEQSAEAVPVLTIGCLRQAGIDITKAVFISPAKAHELHRYRLRHGDVLFSRMATVGRAGFVERRHEGALFNYHVMRLRLRRDAIDSYFFIYFVRGSEVVRSHVRDVNHGMTRDGINTEQLLSMPVPIAPRRTQHGIVDAIDSYLSRLDAAVASLERAQTKLKAYRASVLKAAVEGRLVATESSVARKEGRTYEPADVLLKRILAERRRRWEEAELAKMTAAGKAPRDDKWKARYEEPAPPDTSELPELPEGWCWATVEQVADDIPRAIQSGPFGSNLLHSEFQTQGKLVIGIDNVQDGYFSMGENHRISEAKYSELEHYAARPGDVLITVMATVGRTCVVPDNLEPAIITKHVYRVTPNRSLTDPGYLHATLWGAPAVRTQMFGGVRGQTRPGLNGGIIRMLAIPLPPRAEQQRILEEVERLLSVRDGTVLQLSRTALRATRLRQSILKWAFDGKLVDQDPTDEPADVLLARIRAERAAAAAAPARRRIRRVRA